MTEIAVARIIGILLRKGFVQDESHHTMLRLVVNRRKTRIHTWFSHGRRKADDWLLSQIARELRLSKRELHAFLECTIGGEQYAQLMIDRGHISG
ncbi:MAG: hypothetical protein LAQ69_36230 [Acidobacteriia bacterium]|nr:hypothetical protein [Terriglobia bacterium]